MMDYKKDHLKPDEMSEVLRGWVMYEYMASWAPFYCLTQSWHPFWVYLLYVPIWCYNIKCFNAKEHVVHFITKGEFANKFQPMYDQYKMKTMFYTGITTFNGIWTFYSVV